MTSKSSDPPVTLRNRVHHYVPQCYQRKFLPLEQFKYNYLDLHPTPLLDNSSKKIRDPKGNLIYIRNPDLRAPTSCFCTENLYRRYVDTEFSDDLEDKFFGDIDRRCANSWPSRPFEGFDQNEITAILDFMSILTIRTEKGLDWLATFILRRRPDLSYVTTKHALEGLNPMARDRISNWCDSIWEIVSARNSGSKFILSDHPVTTYHPTFDPLSWVCRYPEDPSSNLVGARTIFPIDMNNCLIISNFEYFLNRNCKNKQKRILHCSTKTSIFHLDDIITGCELSEKEVAGVNFIVKRRARRYIAGGKKEWLYPEQQLATRQWEKLDKVLVPSESNLLSRLLDKHKSVLEAAPNPTVRMIPTRISKRPRKPNKWYGLPP